MRGRQEHGRCDWRLAAAGQDLDGSHGLVSELGLLLLVALDVLEEVVRPDEGPGAGAAHELLLPGVRPLVAAQLVAPGEDLVTLGIGAVKRLLS